MPEALIEFFASRPLDVIARDLLDIFVVAYVVYRALLLIRGTRAMQMGVGLGIVVLVYMAAKWLHLVTLLNLLSALLSSAILIIVVVFQNDIRRALIRVGGRAWLSGRGQQETKVIDEVVAAATELARHRIGALITFEQDANLLEFTKSEGITVNAAVSRELLVALFYPESLNKLHDGAVLIRDLKIERAGVFFPMPDQKIHDAALGSRHRAALGITEETDAVVVVVSEERGTISFCFSGNIVSNLDGQSLRQALLGLFGRGARKKGFGSRFADLASSIRSTPASAGPPTPRPSSATLTPTPAAPRVSMTPVPGSSGLQAAAATAKRLATPKPGTSAPLRPSIEPAERTSSFPRMRESGPSSSRRGADEEQPPSSRATPGRGRPRVEAKEATETRTKSGKEVKPSASKAMPRGKSKKRSRVPPDRLSADDSGAMSALSDDIDDEAGPPQSLRGTALKNKGDDTAAPDSDGPSSGRPVEAKETTSESATDEKKKPGAEGAKADDKPTEDAAATPDDNLDDEAGDTTLNSTRATFVPSAPSGSSVNVGSSTTTPINGGSGDGADAGTGEAP